MTDHPEPQTTPITTTPVTTAPAKRQGITSIIVGFSVFFIGVAVTIVSLADAWFGGRFIVAWGAIVFGLISGIRGIVRYVQSK